MSFLTKTIYYARSIFTLTTRFHEPLKIISLFTGFSKKPDIVRLIDTPAKFHVRSPMDVWSIKETFIDDFYHFNCCPKPAAGVIIDIGAGIGEFAIQAAISCPDCQILGFEPFPESARFFEKNIDLNSLENVDAIAAAVTSLDNDLSLDTSTGNPLQFRPVLDKASKTKIHTIRLLEFLNSREIKEVELLKLDCEGGEYDILLPLKNEDLRRFKRIVMEYHDGLTQHDHVEIIHHLKSSGFAVTVVPNVVHGNIGYLYTKRT